MGQKSVRVLRLPKNELKVGPTSSRLLSSLMMICCKAGTSKGCDLLSSLKIPDNIDKNIRSNYYLEYKQGCALRKITRSPKVPNYELQGAQHKAYMKEIRLSGRPKAKINRLRHPGTLRAQP